MKQDKSLRPLFSIQCVVISVVNRICTELGSKSWSALPSSSVFRSKLPALVPLRNSSDLPMRQSMNTITFNSECVSQSGVWRNGESQPAFCFPDVLFSGLTFLHRCCLISALHYIRECLFRGTVLASASPQRHTPRQASV